MSSSRHTWLTVPELYRLSTACVPICEVFGRPPYLVGSVLARRDYRDVDLRLILDDDDFARRFPDRISLRFLNALISEQLARTTALPIDFQFQSWTENLAEQTASEGNPMPVGMKEALWPESETMSQ